MGASYLQSSLDQLPAARDPKLIELCINPDGTVWGEMQGDHFMRALDMRLTPHAAQDLGAQIASTANTTLSRAKPIVSVSILYRDRPIRAQVIQPPAVEGGFAISLRFFADLPLDKIQLTYLFGSERSSEATRRARNTELRTVVATGDIDGVMGKFG
jgi:type IV secretion system protein VirB11